MQLINRQRYKIIITDKPVGVSSEIAGLYIPVMHNIEDIDNYITDKDLEDATNYVKDYLEGEFSDDSQMSDTESEDGSDDNWTPSPSPPPGILDDLDDDPIDDDELQKLIAVLNKIIQNSPNLLDDPRPVIDLDVYKYGSYLTGSDEFVWEFEYRIHEDSTANAE